MRFVIGFLSLMLVLILAATSPVQAQNQPVPDIGETLEAGSTGHKVTLRVVNSDTKPARGVAVAIVEKPAGVINARIDPAEIAEIAPGASAEMRLQFDIAGKVSDGLLGNIVLSITAQEGKLSRERAIIALAIDGKTDAPLATPEEKPAPVAKTPSKQGSPIMRLTQVLGPRATRPPEKDGEMGIERKPGERGYVVRRLHLYARNQTEIQTAEIVAAPTEIRLGEPFTVTARSKKRHVYGDNHRCHGEATREWNAKRGTAHAYVALYAGHASANAKGAIGATADLTEDLNSYCGAKYDGKMGPTEKEGIVELTVTFQPTKTETTRGYTRWHYAAKTQTDGRLSVDYRRPFQLFWITDRAAIDEQGYVSSDSAKTLKADDRSIEIRTNAHPLFVKGTWNVAASIVLRYSLVTRDDPVQSKLPPFTEPADLSRPPHTSPEVASAGGGKGDDTDPDGKKGKDGAAGAAVASLPPGGDAGGTGATGLKGSGPGGAITLNDIKPGNPVIAGFIREWVTVAEPPANAEKGFRLRYNNRGTAVGVTPGAIVTDRHDTGAFDPNFLWVNRRGLPSLDHCTMEGYVLNRAQGTGSPRCARSKKAATPKVAAVSGLPKLTGMSIKKAKKALADLGLKARLRPGKPAPRKSLFGKVERQKPKPGARTKKGQTVTIYVHSAAKSNVVTVPDLHRMSSREARAALTQAGLKARLRPGGPAPSKSMVGKVRSQSPKSGERLSRNKTVTIYIMAPPSRAGVIPDIRRLRQKDAVAAIRKAGFKPRVIRGRAAPNESLGATVENTDPPAGAQAGRGTEVAVRVYGSYQPTPAERRHKAEEQRRRQAQEKKKRAQREHARRMEHARTYCAQNLSGSTVERSKTGDGLDCVCPGEKVMNKARDACVTSPETLVRNARCGSGAEGYWNASREKVFCRCLSGYVRSGRSCVRQAPQVQAPQVRRQPSAPPPPPVDRAAQQQKLFDALQAIQNRARQQQRQQRQTRPPTTTRRTPSRSPASSCASNYTKRGVSISCRCPGYRFDYARTYCVRDTRVRPTPPTTTRRTQPPVKPRASTPTRSKPSGSIIMPRGGGGPVRMTCRNAKGEKAVPILGFCPDGYY